MLLKLADYAQQHNRNNNNNNNDDDDNDNNKFNFDARQPQQPTSQFSIADYIMYFFQFY